MLDPTDFTPDLLIRAYRRGIFPMARSRHGPIDWYCPDPRAILPLETLHVPRNLRKRVRRGEYFITCDQAFDQVITACAEPRPKSPDSWINPQIIEAYSKLHHMGVAHSLEAWVSPQEERPGPIGREAHNQLAGGLYGVAMGGVFFGESMFSRATDASKVCLVHLVDHLRRRGFTLLDVQFPNPHLEQFGVREIPRHEYLRRLRQAIEAQVRW